MVEVAAARGSSGTHADALLEAGLAGAAILSTVGLLRRRQARHRPLGRRIRLPDPALAATELALRRTETPDRVALIQRALTTLTAPAPPVVGLVVDNDSVELLLAHPIPPPDPWLASSEGFRWRIGAADIAALKTGANDGSAPLPALAPLGRVAAGTADALLNLEAAGLVTVDGDPARAAGLLHAVATNLVGAPWARATDLILVGFPPSMSAADNVRITTSLDDLADELRETAAIMAATLRLNHCDDALAGRLRGIAGDGWPPVVILCARRPTPSEAQLLALVTTPGSGVVAVVANAGAAAASGWTIDVDRQPCPVNPLRVAVEPTVLDAAAAAAIAELLEIAEDDEGAALDDPPYDRIEISVERSAEVSVLRGDGHRRDARNGTSAHNGAHRHPRVEPAAPPEVGDPPILVRVLGSVEVEGAAEFKRAKSRELVVYLAMHPNGVGEAELDEALWGSAGARVVISSTRDSTVSVARSALGGAARLLPAQGQGREKLYRLGPEVASDWSQFCTLHRYGRQHRSAAALHQALELVRGRPFEAVVSGRTFGWIHTEGHGRHIEAEVADAADLAAGLCLDAGDPIAARWAARRGLLAEPYTERLWVRLMEAADAVGESQEIERIMDEMDVVLELEGDFTGLHPNTLAAYDRLSRRHRFPADR
jgi:DNA-binding SARP family transcriptional activator